MYICVFLFVGEQAKNMDESAMNVCLVFDEMDLDAKFSYNQRLKMLIQPAKKLQVVMIRGIVKVVYNIPL